MWERAFLAIREREKDDVYTQKCDKGLTKVRRTFWKKMCGSAFHLWRESLYTTCTMTIEETNAQINMINEEHNSKKLAI